MVATNGRYYLIANYHYYDSIGHYRVDRIKNIRLLENSPAKPASKIPGMENGLDLPVHMAEHIYMFSGDKGTVTMRLSKRILGDVLDWFGKDIRFFDETEDEVSASVVVNYRSMKYWAMQYACFVTITSPPTLAEEIGRDLAAAASKYGH
jgi:predicted DNA-binding transcriptional regulator YafY